MKKHVCLFLSLLFLFSVNSLRAPKRPRSVIKNIERLVSYRYKSKPTKQKRALITLLKDPVQVPAPLLFRSVDLLLQEDTFPFLTQHSQTIDFAVAHFASVPGFNYLLRRIICNHDKTEVKGIMYELEKAAEIERTTDDEHVIAFDKRKQSSTATREFDLITTLRWIECKNVSWKGRKPKQKQQFLDQKSILEEHNKQRITRLTYVVCSKTTISEQWKAWFEQQHIPFCQDASDSHEETE